MTPAFSNPFTMQKIEDLLKLAEAQQPNMTQLTNAQPQEPQPQASGTEIVNREMERAMRPAPNPWENQIRQGVLGAKQAYNAALDAYNNPQSSAAQQSTAQQAMIDQNAIANRFRNAAQSAGLDTSGYGAGVSLADTQSYLDSEKARDITEALKGAYSMTTDQFYERKYEEAIMRGLSARRANRLAGNQAREYQANRVAYLDGLYNSWGHDGSVTNPIGIQVLGMIAQDNPMLANLYAQVYPNPRDAYNTENEMAKTILQSDNALKNALALQSAGHSNRLQEMAQSHGYSLETLEKQYLYQLQNDIFRDDRAAQAKIAEIAAKDAATQREFLRKAQNAHQLAAMLGIPEGSEMYKAVMYQGVLGKDMPNLDKNAFNKEIFSAGKTTIEALENQITGIRERLTAKDLPDNERAELEAQLQRNMDAIIKVTNGMTTQFGVSIQEPNLPPFANNPEKDLPIIKYMLSTAPPNTSREDKLKDIVNWIHETAPDMSVGFIESFLVENGLLPPKTENPNSNSSGTQKSNKERAERAYKAYQNSRTDMFSSNPYWESR